MRLSAALTLPFATLLARTALKRLYQRLEVFVDLLVLKADENDRTTQDKLGERLTSLDNQQTDVAKVIIEEIVWRCTGLSRSWGEQPYGRPPAINGYALGSMMPIFSWSALSSDCSDVLASSVVSMPLSSDGLDGLALVKRCFVSPQICRFLTGTFTGQFTNKASEQDCIGGMVKADTLLPKE